MDWENLRHFRAFAKVSSLAGAARELGVEHATVARRIAALERELGLKLIDRRGRKIALTPAGVDVAAISGEVETKALAIERIAAGQQLEVAGKVTISAPPALGTAILARPLVELRSRASKLSFEILAETRRSSLDRRESDLALRLSRPQAGDLTASKLGEIAFHMYAAPEYLRNRGPDDWEFIGFDASLDDAPHQTTLRDLAAGRPIALRATTAELQLQLALAGGGIAMLPDFLVPADTLVVAHPAEVKREVWMLMHSDMVSSAPVRAVADALGRDIRFRLADWARSSR